MISALAALSTGGSKNLWVMISEEFSPVPSGIHLRSRTPWTPSLTAQLAQQ